MSDHVLEQIPFYINGTLSSQNRRQVSDHLAGCPACREALEAWDLIGSAVRDESSQHSVELPPLSPMVWASIRRPKTTAQAIRSALMLVWAQRVVILRGGPLLGTALAVSIAVLATTLLSLQSSPLLALPLLILVPCLAIIVIPFVHGPDDDPTHELIAATATPAAALIFARLTLALGTIICFSLLGSMALDWVSVSQFGWMVTVWLGPMLLLSGLTTALMLLFRPLASMGISLALWTMVVALLVADTNYTPVIDIRLSWMLNPNWWQFSSQLLAACLLWLFSWILFSRVQREVLMPGGIG